MNCYKKSLFDFLYGSGRGNSNVQFTIPIYQRNYAWEISHCERLLQDIFELAEKNKAGTPTKPHFCGSIVYGINSASNIALGMINNCDIVDGQQRLTTLSLIIKALCKIGKNLSSTSAAFKTSVLPQFDDRLFVSIHAKTAGYKLNLHTNDNNEFIAIMNDNVLTPTVSIKMRENYSYIYNELARFIDNDENNITYIRNALQNFEICSIELETTDNPQDIFETLNSLGKELSIGDLVRNYILMQIPSEDLSIYYAKWCRIEKNCGSEIELNRFINTFLVYNYDTNKGIVDNTRILYSYFRKFSEKIINDTIASAPGKTKVDGLNIILNDLEIMSEIYGYIIGATSATSISYTQKIADMLDGFRKLKITTIYPFLLHIINDYRNGKMAISDLENLISFIFTHIIRNAFLGGSFKSLNSFFATLYKNIFGNTSTSTNSYLDILGTYFAHNRFIVSDSDFRSAILNKNIYKDNRTLTQFVLPLIENCGLATLTHLGTIEHILPQTGDRTGAWASDLGGKSKLDRIRNLYAHTLGNLTLLIPNSALGDKSFKEKLVDYRNPTMCKAGVLYQDIVSIVPIPPCPNPIWNEITIQNRATHLADIMINGTAAIGSAKAIAPIFAYPNFTLIGKTDFTSIVATPSLISGGLHAFELLSLEPTELISKKKPLRELYNSIFTQLYNNGHASKIDGLAVSGGTCLSSKPGCRLKHIIDNLSKIPPKTAKSYNKIGNVYYYNNFSFQDTVEIIKGLLINLSIPFNNLNIYKM